MTAYKNSPYQVSKFCFSGDLFCLDFQLYFDFRQLSLDGNNCNELYINTKNNPKENTDFIIFLLAANVAGIISRMYFDSQSVFGLIPLFDFNVERNIPTMYSALSIFFCALLLLFIGIRHKSNGNSYIPWFGLSAVFVFLSIDETVSVHEKLAKPIRLLLNTSGLLHHAWVSS